MRDWILAGAGIATMAGIIIGALVTGGSAPTIGGIRAEFLLFALTLLGVAFLHHQTLGVALCGLFAIVVLRLAVAASGGLAFDPLQHLQHEAATLINLFGLLIGFAILARHFEASGVPDLLPRYLPDDWKGGFVLLLMVFVLSAFLDNIAAAIIGGTVANQVYKGRVDIGYLAAIVAASNAGGAGSVVGDTTTTMMWIDGVDAGNVVHAYVAALPATLLFGVVAAVQQHRFQAIRKDPPQNAHFGKARLVAVLLILIGAIATNVWLDFPAAGVWFAILVVAPFVRTDWRVVGNAFKGSVFLLSLVVAASLMPVQDLPLPSAMTVLGIGFVSAVFDNIPLTKLALEQGGYDWGVLAYAVGFGGSMIWFGSSAGVALSGLFPQAKSAGLWLKRGWHVVLAYVFGFFVMLALVGWHPHAPHRNPPSAAESAH
jgi:Na+/H+ antiporter NhaD/arsenite permease-like protein